MCLSNVFLDHWANIACWSLSPISAKIRSLSSSFRKVLGIQLEQNERVYHATDDTPILAPRHTGGSGSETADRSLADTALSESRRPRHLAHGAGRVSYQRMYRHQSVRPYHSDCTQPLGSSGKRTDRRIVGFTRARASGRLSKIWAVEKKY
jgi:hypothetical protein